MLRWWWIDSFYPPPLFYLMEEYGDFFMEVSDLNQNMLILGKFVTNTKYGVPANLLKITKMLITRDNMLEISLELKKV